MKLSRTELKFIHKCVIALGILTLSTWVLSETRYIGIAGVLLIGAWLTLIGGSIYFCIRRLWHGRTPL